MLNIKKIEAFLKQILDPNNISDYGINGIQIECERIIKKIGFAVDTSMDSVKKAVENNCDLLIAHHGIFWGKPVSLTGSFRKKIKCFLENDIGLIAFHHPLDYHEEYGNNIQILKEIGIKEAIPFGNDKGFKIGWQGELNSSMTISKILDKLELNNKEDYKYLNFGNNDIKKVAVVSGSGSRFFDEAINDEIDLFITGDNSHILYHKAKENCMNILFAGHYFTEIFGIKAIMDLLEKEFNVKTIFFDIPTGL